MSINILSFFIFSFVLIQVLPQRLKRSSFVVLSILCLYNVNDQFLVAGLVLLLVNEGIKALYSKMGWSYHKMIPLIYSFIFILGNHLSKNSIVGASYLVLAASMDLEAGFKRRWDMSFLKLSFFNLLSFPKSSIGPINSVEDHHALEMAKPEQWSLAGKKILVGVTKAFILLPLFREQFPVAFFKGSHVVADFMGYGLWNYIILYLEFSGICDIVIACFYGLGLNCRENFQTPYFSLSITDFWKRWHMSLGRWIREYIYIAFGGNRVGQTRLYFNLFSAMFLCGAWHGLTWNFLLWGGLQGLFMVVERVVGFEKVVAQLPKPMKVLPWLLIQSLVIASWAVFFAWAPR